MIQKIGDYYVYEEDKIVKVLRMWSHYENT